MPSSMRATSIMLRSTRKHSLGIVRMPLACLPGLADLLLRERTSATRIKWFYMSVLYYFDSPEWPFAGFVVAKGQVCGREVHACYLDTGVIAQSSKQAACRGLCSMVDAAILVSPLSCASV